MTVEYTTRRYIDGVLRLVDDGTITHGSLRKCKLTATRTVMPKQLKANRWNDMYGSVCGSPLHAKYDDLYVFSIRIISH